MSAILKNIKNVLMEPVLASWMAAAGTFFLGYIALKGLRRDSVPRMRVRIIRAYDGFIDLVAVNAGKVPVFIENVDVRGDSVGEVYYEIIGIKEFMNRSTSKDDEQPAVKRLPYPLIGGEKVKITLKVFECEKEPRFPEVEEFFGEEKFTLKVKYRNKPDKKADTALDSFSL